MDEEGAGEAATADAAQGEPAAAAIVQVDEGGVHGEEAAAEMEVGEPPVAENKPRAPQDTEELLLAIATQDYGVSDDRSSKLTAPALRAYNAALKSEYGHYELKRGRTLPEGFTIVKVSAS